MKEKECENYCDSEAEYEVQAHIDKVWLCYACREAFLWGYSVGGRGMETTQMNWHAEVKRLRSDYEVIYQAKMELEFETLEQKVLICKLQDILDKLDYDGRYDGEGEE